MGLNNASIFENSCQLTSEEIKMAKNFIEKNQDLMQATFNMSLDKLKDIFESINKLQGREKRDEDYYKYTLAQKAVLIMKENGAKTLNDMGKLNVDFYSINKQIYSIQFKEQTQIMANLKERAAEQQEKDFKKAKDLSEKIKNGDEEVKNGDEEVNPQQKCKATWNPAFNNEVSKEEIYSCDYKLDNDFYNDINYAGKISFMCKIGFIPVEKEKFIENLISTQKRELYEETYLNMYRKKATKTVDMMIEKNYLLLKNGLVYSNLEIHVI